MILGGGFNPFKKYSSNWKSSPNRGEHKRYIWKHLLDMIVSTWWKKINMKSSTWNIYTKVIYISAPIGDPSHKSSTRSELVASRISFSKVVRSSSSSTWPLSDACTSKKLLGSGQSQKRWMSVPYWICPYASKIGSSKHGECTFFCNIDTCVVYGSYGMGAVQRKPRVQIQTLQTSTSHSYHLGPRMSTTPASPASEMCVLFFLWGPKKSCCIRSWNSCGLILSAHLKTTVSRLPWLSHQAVRTHDTHEE